MTYFNCYLYFVREMHVLIESLVILGVKETKFNLLSYTRYTTYLYCILIYLIHLSCLNFYCDCQIVIIQFHILSTFYCRNSLFWLFIDIGIFSFIDF